MIKKPKGKKSCKRRFLEPRISKHSQMRIMEMSFMIIGITVFFVLVGLFWLSISISGMRERVETSTRESAILLVSRLAGSPEFECSDTKPLCVDADKLLVLKDHKNYARFWQVDGIQVKKVYPYENKTIECSEGNYPGCNVFTIKPVPSEAGLVEDSSFISLCREEYKNGYNYKHCELGKISVFTKKQS